MVRFWPLNCAAWSYGLRRMTKRFGKEYPIKILRQSGSSDWMSISRSALCMWGGLVFRAGRFKRISVSTVSGTPVAK